jgi:hypothetical protein
MQAMAGSVAVVASVTGKRRSLKTVSKTELGAIRLMWADAFRIQNRCSTADCGHEGYGSGDGAVLIGGRCSVGEMKLTSGDGRDFVSVWGWLR